MNYGMSLRSLLEGWLDDVPDVAISGITQVAARVQPGDAFVMPNDVSRASIGELREALNRGCAAIVHDGIKGLSLGDTPAVRLPGLSQRMGELASRFWAAPSDLLTVAAISGARGRSAVSGFLAQVWQRSCMAGDGARRRGRHSVATLQPSSRPAPDVFSLNEALAACVDNGVEQVAVEVSPEALIQGRCQTLQVDLALITSVGPRSGDRYAERSLLTEFAPRFSVLNMDEPTGRQWAREFCGKTETFGIGFDPRAEMSVRISASSEEGMLLRFVGPWGEAAIQTTFTGRGNALNLLASAAALTLLGMDWDETCRQLEYLHPTTRSVPLNVDCGMRVNLERAA